MEFWRVKKYFLGNATSFEHIFGAPNVKFDKSS